MMEQPLLSVENVSVAYYDNGRWSPVTHDVTFSLHSGESIALVGESGSGKTTTAQAILGLLPDNARKVAGRVLLNGQDLSHWSQTRLQHIRGKVMSLIPQDPTSSLDPLMKVGNQIAEVFRIHNALPSSQIRTRVIELLEEVGLNEPEREPTNIRMNYRGE